MTDTNRTTTRVTLATTAATICDSQDHEAIENGAFSDGFNSSPGVMSVLQGLVPENGTLNELWADGFADDSQNHREFLMELLGELSAEEDILAEIRELGDGDTITHEEQWGSRITIQFTRENGCIVATFPHDDVSLRVVCE